MADVVSYADKNYQQKKVLYDVLAQVLEDVKYGKSHSSFGANALHGGTSWNKPVAEVQGVTLRLIGEKHLELTYHHFETTTIDGLAMMGQEGKKFINEVVKQLKKGFEAYTGKKLKLKEIKEDRAYDKYSRLQADTSWMLGSSRYGYGARPVGRYLVRDSCLYEFSANL